MESDSGQTDGEWTSQLTSAEAFNTDINPDRYTAPSGCALGFDGVVVSDALDMHAISQGVGRGAGAVSALKAGVDLICIGNPCFSEPYDGERVFNDVRRDIEAAVDDGTLAIMRLEEAAGRIDALTAWLDDARSRKAPQTDADTKEARMLGREVAIRTVRAVGDVRLGAAPRVLVEQRNDIAAGRLPSPVTAALAARSPATTSVVRSAGDVAAVGELESGRPIVLVTDGLAGDNVVRAVRRVRSDAVVVHVGPAPVGDEVVAPPVVLALGNGAANAEAAADLLLGPA